MSAKVTGWVLGELEQALRRDPCAYCGAAADVLDHIVPLRNGGDSSVDNYTAACAPCNRAKGGMSLLAFLGKQRHDAATRAVYDAIVAERSAWGAVGRR